MQISPQCLQAFKEPYKRECDPLYISFGNRIARTRKKQNLQGDLALKIGLHIVFGRYERDEALPSVEVAAKIAEALAISLDYLTELIDVELDPSIFNRIQEIALLANEDQEHVFKVVDSLIKDAKAKRWTIEKPSTMAGLKILIRL